MTCVRPFLCCSPGSSSSVRSDWGEELFHLLMNVPEGLPGASVHPSLGTYCLCFMELRSCGAASWREPPTSSAPTSTTTTGLITGQDCPPNVILMALFRPLCVMLPYPSYHENVALKLKSQSCFYLILLQLYRSITEYLYTAGINLELMFCIKSLEMVIWKVSTLELLICLREVKEKVYGVASR